MCPQDHVVRVAGFVWDVEGRELELNSSRCIMVTDGSYFFFERSIWLIIERRVAPFAYGRWVVVRTA